MLNQDPSDKDFIRLPKITHKTKSLHGNQRPHQTHEAVSAKAWYYCTPNSQFGNPSPHTGFKSTGKR